MKRWRLLLLPVLVSLPILLILLALGTWQVERLRWKTGLLADFAAAEAGPALPLANAPRPWSKVFTEGRFRNDREALLGLEVRGGVLGAHLLVPLERAGMRPLLVNRGWVPLERGARVSRPEGEVRVVGYVRPSEPHGLFSAHDDLTARHFYTLDIPVIGPALGYDNLEPFALVVLAPAGVQEEGLPQPAPTLPRPANNHLGYVVTWYGLALALLGVFIVWARARLKEPEE